MLKCLKRQTHNCLVHFYKRCVVTSVGFVKGEDHSNVKLSKRQTNNCLVHFYKRCVATSVCFVKGEDHSNVKLSKRQTNNCLVHFYKRCVVTSKKKNGLYVFLIISRPLTRVWVDQGPNGNLDVIWQIDESLRRSLVRFAVLLESDCQIMSSDERTECV